MIRREDLSFYAPWPLFGVNLSAQWREVRQNFAVISPIARNVIIYQEDVPTDDPNIDTTLAGFEFGEQDFHNKFRFIWDESPEDFLFQYNVGTEADPIWETAFYVDPDGGTYKIVFDKDVLFNKNAKIVGDFYALPDNDTVSISDGTRKLTSLDAHFSVNDGDFYLDLDSRGNPKINIGRDLATTIVFRDGVNTHTSDTISFNDGDFYLDTDSEGKPKLNFRGSSSLTVQDGVRDLVSSANTFSVNQNEFYLDTDSEGNPKINLVSAGGGGGSPLTVKEIDGSPTVPNVTTIRVSNSTLTNDGSGQVTITTGGGGGGDVTFTDGTNTHTSSELNFNSSDFYLSTDLNGDPVVNLIGDSNSKEVVLASNASQINISNISQDGDILEIYIESRSSRTNSTIDQLTMEINGDSGTNYVWYEWLKSQGSADTTSQADPDSTARVGRATTDHVSSISNLFAFTKIVIPNYTNTSRKKVGHSDTGVYRQSGGSNQFASTLRFVYESTNAITSLKFTLDNGNFVSGSTVTVVSRKF